MLRTDLSAEECLRRLGEATDVGKRTIFSFSGYKGSKPVLATFDGNRFTLWKRLYYRNDLRPRFYGTLIPQERGCRVEGYFAVDPRIKFVLFFWVGISVFVDLSVLIPLMSRPMQAGDWVAAAAPTIIILALAFAFMLGRRLAGGHKAFLKEFIETTLAATPDAGSVVVSQRVIDNTPL
ncbi:MAG: hypothetical protein WB716_07070 [Candidatus Acidiferrales bacterium]